MSGIQQGLLASLKASTGGYIPNANTKSYFKLNNDLTDSSGNGNNGTDVNANITFANGGPNAKCGVFSSSRMTATSPAITGNFTLGAWIKRNGLSNPNGAIVDVGQYSTTGFGLWTWSNDAGQPTNSISWRINGNYNNFTAMNVVIPDATWTRVIIVYNGTDIRTYTNGTLVSTISGTTNPSSDTTFCIGDRKDAAGNYFKGYIAEVFTENTNWTSTQVTNDYNSFTIT